MLRVVIVGYGEMFTNLIAAALDANCEVVGVLRNETVKYSPIVKKMKDIFNPSRDYNYIKSYGIKEIQAESVNSKDFRDFLIKQNVDILLVGSWGEKFEKLTYDIPKIASINVHPSLLPKYRGPNPYFWMIRNQEQVGGVTFHLIDNKYDNGAILAQEEVKIFSSDTGESLKQRTVLTARGVACELLKALNDDIIIPLKQREDKATYFSYPEGLELNFKKTAEENLALIRAIHPWNRTHFFHNITALSPNPFSTYIEENNSEYSISGTIVDVDIKTKTISVLCNDGKLLKMSNVTLYKKWDRPFTKNYISREVKVGQVLI